MKILAKERNFWIEKGMTGKKEVLLKRKKLN